MTILDSVKLVSGSVAIYVVMAACSSASSPPPAPLSAAPVGVIGVTDAGEVATNDANGAPPSPDGALSGEASSDSAGLLDAITNPVPPASADPYQSGTRLKANYLSGPDGSRQFVGWHDSLTGVDCEYGTASDGMMRCLPTGGQLAGYADAACTQAVASVPKGCAAPAFAKQPTPPVNGCGPTTLHLYTVSPAAIAMGPSAYAKIGAACSAIFGGTANADYYPAVETPPAAYAQATLLVEP